MKNKLKAVIFDMDGILIDSEPLTLLNIYNFLNSKNIPVDFKELEPLMGSTGGEVWFDVLTPHITTCEITRLRQEYYSSKYNKKPTDYNSYSFPYVDSIFKYLKNNDILIGVASASKKSLITKVIKDCNWGKYIDVYVSGHDVKLTKPHPDVYIKALELLNVLPHEAIAIEDSFLGIKSAVSANIFTIAKKDRRFNVNANDSNLILEDMFDILRYFIELFESQ